MPIYEYPGLECRAISDFFTVIEENEALTCKACGSNRLEKVLSVSAVLTKVSERAPGRTCCGREERCSTPPCASDGVCRKDQN